MKSLEEGKAILVEGRAEGRGALSGRAREDVGPY